MKTRDRKPPGLRQALEDLAWRRVSATELTRHALDKAEACKTALNAFSIVAREHALRAAEDSDRRYAAGRQRSLEGLPIAVKDLIDTRGIETRYGSAAYVGNVPAADAEVVRTLVELGAVVIGKTTTHEFAWGVTTDSPAFGQTLNPLDKTRIPGGSSGGAAAAIGFGAVAGGLGTDTGGSVRIPAALCGVVGFKPTQGRFSTQGIFPLAQSLDHAGLLGASVDDVIVLATALGIEVQRGNAWRSARLGILREIAPVPLSADVGAAFDRAVQALQGTFATQAIEATGPFEGLFDGVFKSFATIVLTEGGMEHFRRNDWAFIAAHYGPETVQRLDLARDVVLRDYALAQQARRCFAQKLHRLMSTVDYLVLPTLPCTAPRLGETALAIDGWSGNVREALMTYTAPFNVAGFPAISIPLPAREHHLPAALQIVARPGEDAELLHIAQNIASMR